MSTTAERVGATEGGSGGGSEVVRVTVPPHSLASELRAIRIVWRRDLIRFANDRIRIAASLIQPLLFLFVMGSGLQRLSSAGTHGVNLKTFIYPGILCIAVMFTAMFSAASIVWDPAVPGSCRLASGRRWFSAMPMLRPPTTGSRPASRASGPISSARCWLIRWCS